ncbi:unnamed protein product [Dibothriocephalus latus]|uniref:CHD N-terminal domain-containing protein n=1 Tax=Dibothriocephalus latus TaxID=60516 RepID=A0A3P7NQA5_DIBLA|nr:unnamed protein product [Dibothriocephalus latus]
MALPDNPLYPSTPPLDQAPDRRARKRKSRSRMLEIRKRARVKRHRTDDDGESSGSASKRKVARQSKEKTLEQLCEELGVEDVELTYSTDDFENWTVQKLFDQYVRPLIVEKNANASKDAIQQILDAKWKEFAIMNPYIPKGEEELLEEDEDDNTAFEVVDEDTQDASSNLDSSRRGASRTLTKRRSYANGSNVDSSQSVAMGDNDSEEVAVSFDLPKERRGGGNTSDEEFERQLVEAEAVQDEERERRRQRLDRRRVQKIHVSSSAPNLQLRTSASAGGGKPVIRGGVTRFPLMGGNKTAEDGYETDHQDYCDVCQQVRPEFLRCF